MAEVLLEVALGIVAYTLTWYAIRRFKRYRGMR